MKFAVIINNKALNAELAQSYLNHFDETGLDYELYKIESKQLDKTDKQCVSERTSFLMVSNNLYTYEFPLTIKRESFKKATLGCIFSNTEK